MMKLLIAGAFAGAALFGSSDTQAQTRVVAPRTPLPSTGSAFAVKNGGAFANQGGIAAQPGSVRGGSLIGENTGTWIKNNNGAGFRGR
ncbi:hypothetical protein [Methylobacterium terrae]|uniref:hypothetical protein n=1 Tax=Methylobacterium terrae TaxID=2202827 RepID=UPI0013A565A1|nr:hypothetical protein [Methylobacterium terrae]